MTAQVPFYSGQEHKANSAIDISRTGHVTPMYDGSYKTKCQALNKQVEKAEWVGQGWKGSGSGSVILIPVLLARGGFGSTCWFGHDDLEGEGQEGQSLSNKVPVFT